MMIGTLNAYKYQVLKINEKKLQFINKNSALGIQKFDTKRIEKVCKKRNR